MPKRTREPDAAFAPAGGATAKDRDPRQDAIEARSGSADACWQIDATARVLVGGVEVEIVNLLDDHSRLAVASAAVASTTTEAAWAVFEAAARRPARPDAGALELRATPSARPPMQHP